MTALLERQTKRVALLAKVMERALCDGPDVAWAFEWGDQRAPVTRIVWHDRMLLCARFDVPGEAEVVTLFIGGDSMLVQPVRVTHDPCILVWALAPGG